MAHGGTTNYPTINMKMVSNALAYRVRLLAIWLFAIGLTGILLGYQTTLLTDLTPSQPEELMLWLTSRAMLILTIICGYLGARHYERLIKNRPARANRIIGGWLVVLGTLAVGYYLVTGDTTMLGLTTAGVLLVATMAVRARWVLLTVALLVLNVPGQLGRWVQANRNYPMPVSEQVNAYEASQRSFRHKRQVAAQHWLTSDYRALVRYHASVWPEQWLEQSSRWLILIGAVLLGMGLWRWQRLIIRLMNTLLVSLLGLCILTTFLELTSGRVYSATLHRYADSYRYPGYYVFDVPDALYLTVAELACLSMAVLASLGFWLVVRMPIPRWVPVRRPAL